MRFTSLLYLATTFCATTIALDAAGKPADGAQNDLGSIPIDSIDSIQVVISSEEVVTKPSPRHDAEKENLQARLDRSKGKWDKAHPRYRLLDALHGYLRYKELQTNELNKWRKYYKNASKPQKKLLEAEVGYVKKMNAVEHLLDVNKVVCDAIVETGLDFYGVSKKELDEHVEAVERDGKTADRVSVSQTLKHFVRDWSEEGVSERDAAFPCIVQALEGIFPDRSAEHVKLLLPGAGVGRLGHQISSLGGFEVTNNEWSMYMNLGYRFLESHPVAKSHAIHPFVDGWSHHATTADMLRKVTFPEHQVNASAVLLVEGDFTRVFEKHAGHYDALVTHYFIDTARNLMAYFDTIHSLIKKGGYWVNFGPLLYGTGPYMQLSLEEVVKVVKAYGFEFVEAPEVCGALTFEGEKIRGRESAYGFNDRALTKHAYIAQAWVMKKVR